MARRPVARDASSKGTRRSWGGILFGFIFVVVGSAVGLGFPTESKFQCDRDAKGGGDCHIIESALAWSSIDSFDVGELTGAIVEMDDGDEGPVCRVTVTLKDERYVPLSLAWTTCAESMRTQASKISAYAKASEPGDLMVDRSIGWWIMVFALAFILAGSLTMVLSARER